MKKRLLIVGGYGSGEIAMSVFQEMNAVTQEWEILGFLNDIKKPGEYLGKYPVVGGSDEIKDYVNKGYFIHYTYHMNAKNKKERISIFEQYGIPLEASATGIHPRSYLDPSTEIGKGVLICANVCTSFHVKIGNFIHCYTNSFLGHDTIVGDFSTIAAHSVIGGRNRIGKGVHIGLNVTTREEVSIGKYAIAGMAAVVLNDVPDGGVIVGNPGRLLRVNS
jgi:acetyltransferase EpsM